MAGELAKFFVTISSKFDAAGLDATVKKVEELEKKSENLAKGFKIVGGALVTMAATGTAVLFDLTKSAMDSEKAQVMWNQALKQAGIYSDAASQHGIDYANSLQKITTYTDEAILSVETMLTRFGVEGPMLDKLTEATLDLAAAKGMDLSSAADLVAKSVGSDTNALSRYGIVIEGTKGSTERMQMAVENISTLFGGAAQANANTMAGKIEILKNQFDDFKEKLGAALLPMLEKLLAHGMKLVDWLNKLSPQTQDAITKFILWGTAIAGVLAPMLLFIAYNAKIVLALTQVGASLKAVLLLLSGPAGLVIALGLAIAEWARYKEMTAKADNQSNIAIKTKAGMVAEIKHETDMLIQQRSSLDKHSGAYERLTEKIKQNEKTIEKLTIAARDEAREMDKNSSAVKINKDAVVSHQLSTEELSHSLTIKGQRLAQDRDSLIGAAQASKDYTDGQKIMQDEIEGVVAVMGDHIVKLGEVGNGMVIMGDEEDKLKDKTKKMTDENAAAFITMANTIFASGATIQNTFSVIVDGVSRMFDPVTGAAIQLGGTIIGQLFWGNREDKKEQVIDENLKIINDWINSIRRGWGQMAVDMARAISDALSSGDINTAWDNVLTALRSMFKAKIADLLAATIFNSGAIQTMMQKVSGLLNVYVYHATQPVGTPGIDAGFVGNQLKDSITNLISTLNPLFTSIYSIFGNLDSILPIPAMASGGIVTGPTLAMVGEAGPEAVIPLGQMGGLNIYIQDNYFSDDRMVDTLAEKLVKVIKNNVRI